MYRISNASANLRRCPTTSCAGGVNEASGVNCRNNTAGVYCSLCAEAAEGDRAVYFDAETSMCLPCDDDITIAIVAAVCGSHVARALL